MTRKLGSTPHVGGQTVPQRVRKVWELFQEHLGGLWAGPPLAIQDVPHTMRSPSPVAATSALRGTWRSSGSTISSQAVAPGSGYDSRTSSSE